MTIALGPSSTFTTISSSHAQVSSLGSKQARNIPIWHVKKVCVRERGAYDLHLLEPRSLGAPLPPPPLPHKVSSLLQPYPLPQPCCLSPLPLHFSPLCSVCPSLSISALSGKGVFLRLPSYQASP